jgi:hypothetical protein
MGRRWLVVVIALLSVGTAQLVPAQEVEMPLAAYDALRARAGRTPPPPEQPAIPIALSAASIDVTVDGAAARITETLEVAILGDGWQRLPIPAVGTFVAADLGELEGRISADGGWALEVRGVGVHRVRLEALVSLERDESSTRPVTALSVPLPTAATVDGVVHAATGIDELRLVTGGLIRGRTADGGWLVAGEPGATLQLNLLGPAVRPVRDTLPLRFDSGVGLLIEPGRTRTRATAWVAADVRQGLLDKLQVEVPEGWDVLGVDGDGLAGWDVSDRIVEVTPLEPARGRLQISVRLAHAPHEELATPFLRVVDADSQVSASMVRPEGDGMLELVEDGASHRLTPAECIRVSSKLYLLDGLKLVADDPSQPTRWLVTWPTSTDALAAQVDRLRVDVVTGRDGTADYRVWVEVRTSGAPELVIGVPAGFELVGGSRDGLPLVPGRSAAGLTIPLTGVDRPQVVALEGLLPLEVPDDGEMTVPLPSLSAPAGRVEVRVALPADRAAKPLDASRTGNLGAPPQPVAGAHASSNAVLTWLATTNPQLGDGTLAPLRGAAGATVVEAAWSALSAHPDPLRLQIEGEKVAREWF